MDGSGQMKVAGEWPEVPETERFYVPLLDRASGVWRRDEMRNLKRGDIFRMFNHDGVQISAFELAGCDPDIVAYAYEDARHNYLAGRGWGLECEWGEFADILKMFCN
jgi:hypothetical protein